MPRPGHPGKGHCPAGHGSTRAGEDRAGAFTLINEMCPKHQGWAAPLAWPHTNSQCVTGSADKSLLRRADKITTEPNWKVLFPNSHCTGLRITSSGKIASQQSSYNSAYMTVTCFYISIGVDFNMARARSGNGMSSTQY